MKLNCVAAAMGVVAFASPACLAQGMISETFESVLNGWTTYNDTGTPMWSSAGNPGGCALGRDQGSGIYWGFVAPAAFLGEKSCYYGGTFRWQLSVSHNDSVANTNADISIRGAGLFLLYDLPHPTPVNTWLSRSVPLSEVGWHINTITGAQPTAAQFQAAMANLTEIRLRMEYSTAIDTDKLDNVFMIPGPSCPSCDPDVNRDGNADQGDVDYLVNVVAGGENSSGIDPDFNQDGNADQGDVDSLLNVIAGGACP